MLHSPHAADTGRTVAARSQSLLLHAYARHVWLQHRLCPNVHRLGPRLQKLRHARRRLDRRHEGAHLRVSVERGGLEQPCVVEVVVEHKVAPARRRAAGEGALALAQLPRQPRKLGREAVEERRLLRVKGLAAKHIHDRVDGVELARRLEDHVAPRSLKRFGRHERRHERGAVADDRASLGQLLAVDQEQRQLTERRLVLGVLPRHAVGVLGRCVFVRDAAELENHPRGLRQRPDREVDHRELWCCRALADAGGLRESSPSGLTSKCACRHE
mmetsp:Transcript_38936/g.122789  ORF Transcript_38936/g.122789 Transcript_38936/m.122789 type:complete len:272 (-) Transcript_38936:557-1372(-)